ncbi:hypothetical protein EXIGLDRAFT_778291 [Exidia glandulosa HHB12029]|uniref:Uncharacterized protein n=1 Tax=Exidia glandulosa HHB12029 TaxID=1314781 RepID=A0A165CLN5_EXIGL|nr:hypothetical protein EXIGLDRAFT_778291 [Exidia glandulosa HHB12029]
MPLLKLLEGASLQAPTPRKSAQLGTIKRKSWSTITHIVKRAEEDDGGKMFRAPKPFAQHIVVTGVPATPTPDAPVDLSASKRVSHPTSVLKHRFSVAAVATKFNLSVPFGTAPQDFFLSRVAYPDPSSVVTLFINNVLPTTRRSRPARCSRPASRRDSVAQHQRSIVPVTPNCDDGNAMSP